MGGGPIMCEVARIARQDFGVEPACLLPFDEPPPNHPHLSEYGYELLCTDPQQWLKEWNPNMMKVTYTDYGIATRQKDASVYAHDNKFYNTYRRACPQYDPFKCDI